MSYTCNFHHSDHKTLWIAGLLSVTTYLYLAIHSQSYAQASLSQLLWTSGFCASLSFWVWHHYNRNEKSLPIITMLVFAVLFRIIGLCAFPILEDDVFRYLWDGRSTIEFGSPYGHAPADFFDTDVGDRFEDILGLINYPSVATIYGPVNQWVFAFGYLIAPGEIWPLQAIFIAADLLLIYVLLKLAQPVAVLLYAWSPLIIKEFAFTAHPDVMGAMFLALALLNYQKHRFIMTGLLLALAAGIKVFALVMAPFLLGWQWRGWLAFFLTAAAIAWPFGLEQAWLPDGLRAMGSDWLFNAPIYELLLHYLPIHTIKLGLLGLYLLTCGLYGLYAMYYWWQNQTPLKTIRVDLIIAGLLICLPALNAWYLVWLLPFAVIKLTLWPWVASVSIFLSYASGINLDDPTLQPYEHKSWILIIEFGLVAIAAVLQPVLRKRK